MRRLVRGQLSRAHEQIEAGASGVHLRGTTFDDSFAQDILSLQRTIMVSRPTTSTAQLI
jgi:hypothetical protein